MKYLKVVGSAIVAILLMMQVAVAAPDEGAGDVQAQNDYVVFMVNVPVGGSAWLLWKQNQYVQSVYNQEYGSAEGFTKFLETHMGPNNVKTWETLQPGPFKLLIPEEYVGIMPAVATTSNVTKLYSESNLDGVYMSSGQAKNVLGAIGGLAFNGYGDKTEFQPVTDISTTTTEVEQAAVTEDSTPTTIISTEAPSQAEVLPVQAEAQSFPVAEVPTQVSQNDIWGWAFDNSLLVAGAFLLIAGLLIAAFLLGRRTKVSRGAVERIAVPVEIVELANAHGEKVVVRISQLLHDIQNDFLPITIPDTMRFNPRDHNKAVVIRARRRAGSTTYEYLPHGAQDWMNIATALKHVRDNEGAQKFYGLHPPLTVVDVLPVAAKIAAA